MNFLQMVGEYAKLARSFNMALTGMAPVFGALSMCEFNPLRLVALFVLGCAAHIYGFVLNDYMDARIDRHSKELAERPLVSGTISPRNALIFAFSGLAIMMIIGLLLTFPSPTPMIILIAAAVCATIYNLISKKAPGMDFFVAGAVALLTLFGAASSSINITLLAVNVTFLAFLQVMFMNVVAGGLKDIDHDYTAGGKNIAIAMGCRVERNGNTSRLVVPWSFKATAHILEILFITGVTFPFFSDYEVFSSFNFMSAQFFVIVILACAMMLVSTKLMSMSNFIRSDMRKLIGTHYALNFSMVPVMLSTLAPWIFLFAFIPPLGFALTNKLLHGEAMAPKTM